MNCRTEINADDVEFFREYGFVSVPVGPETALSLWSRGDSVHWTKQVGSAGFPLENSQKEANWLWLYQGALLAGFHYARVIPGTSYPDVEVTNNVVAYERLHAKTKDSLRDFSGWLACAFREFLGGTYSRDAWWGRLRALRYRTQLRKHRDHVRIRAVSDLAPPIETLRTLIRVQWPFESWSPQLRRRLHSLQARATALGIAEGEARYWGQPHVGEDDVPQVLFLAGSTDHAVPLHSNVRAVLISSVFADDSAAGPCALPRN